MSRLEPTRADRFQPLAPEGKPAREDFHEHIEEHPRIGRRAAESSDVGHPTVEPGRMVGQIDADADHYRVVSALEQDAGELCAAGENVIGPLYLEFRFRRRDAESFVKRDCGGQRERRCWRIVRPQPDERAGVEISRRGMPIPPLAPAPSGLALGAEPEALRCALPRKAQDVVVCGTGLLDRPDQNRALAAFSETALSGPSTRCPSGETKIAQTRIIALSALKPRRSNPGAVSSKYMTLTIFR